MLPKTPHEPKIVWSTPKGYAASHCMNCKAGWTRTATIGGSLTVCLLDREPVLAEMANCDRYQARSEPEAED
jgi:hypothetical protein